MMKGMGLLRRDRLGMGAAQFSGQNGEGVYNMDASQRASRMSNFVATVRASLRQLEIAALAALMHEPK